MYASNIRESFFQPSSADSFTEQERSSHVSVRYCNAPAKLIYLLLSSGPRGSPLNVRRFIQARKRSRWRIVFFHNSWICQRVPEGRRPFILIGQGCVNFYTRKFVNGQKAKPNGFLDMGMGCSIQTRQLKGFLNLVRHRRVAHIGLGYLEFVN
jgi:hypothetical protein